MIKKSLFGIIIFAAICAGKAHAQFSIGPKIGFTNTSVSFNKLLETKKSVSGFTGGITAEYMFYAGKLGFDISVLYTHRGEKSDLIVTNEDGNIFYDMKNSRDYLDIPVNFKWKIIDNKLLSPYVFTGPQVSFRLSKQQQNETINNKTVVLYWNFGVGLEIIRSLQVGLSYGLGISNSVDYSGITGKDRNLTLTAVYLFRL